MHDLLAAGSVEKVEWVIEKIIQSFKTNHLRRLPNYNGCALVHDRKAETMLMHQKACVVEKLLERLGVTKYDRNHSPALTFVPAEDMTEERFKGSFIHLAGEPICVASNRCSV